MTRRVKQRRTRPHQQDDADDVVDTLDAILQTLLHVLACSACEACGGTGMTVDGQNVDGKPRFTRCGCRRVAGEWVQGFEP